MLARRTQDAAANALLCRISPVDGYPAFLRAFRMELSRVCSGRWFCIALGICCALSLAQVAISTLPVLPYLGNGQGAYPLSVYMCWIGAGGVDNALFASLYFFLLPMLAALPHAGTYKEDLSAGYLNQIAVRMARRPYLVAKYLSTFLSAGIVAVAPLMLNLFATALLLPTLPPQANTGFFPLFSYSFLGDFFYVHPLGYVAIYLCIDFVFVGLMATLGLCAAPYCKNPFTSVMTPFVVQLLLFVAAELGGMPQLVPFAFLRPSQPVAANPLVMCVEVVVMLALGAVYLFGGERRDVL